MRSSGSSWLSAWRCWVDEQGAPPATDASGEVDFGHIDSLVWDGNAFELEGDWGRMEVSAARAEVEISA